MVLDEATGQLQFGTQSAGGQVKAVFSVDAQGNITADGEIKVPVKPGSMLVQSGRVTDGMLVPLPAGITEDQVQQGQVTVFVHVTPAAPGSIAPPGFPLPATLECFVDADRRLRCTTRWFGISGGAFTTKEEPSAADYTTIVSVPARSSP